MNQTLKTISTELNIDLEKLADQIPEKEQFLSCCDDFLSKNQGEKVQPLPFCTYLRKNGFPIVSRTICQFFINTNPGALTRTLAA